MICPKCHGTKRIYKDTAQTGSSLKVMQYVPCEECHGTGIIHCCDGLKEENLNEDDD